MIYLVRRCLTALVSLALASMMVFGALLAIPGDPAEVILGIDADPAALAALRARLGLDQPPLERYLHWAARVLKGDLGDSIRYGRPVSELIAGGLLVTLPLVISSGLLALIIAIPLGTLAAAHRGKALDLFLVVTSQLGLAVPSFWLGLILILVFGVALAWLPTTGVVDWSVDPLRAAQSLILPVVTLALSQAAILTRLVRSTVLEVLELDYIRTARAKGLPQRVVLARHALRSALLSVLTLSGVLFGQLLAGAIIVESVFALPALGRLALTAVEARDFILIQGIVLVLATLIVAANLVVDLLYGVLDPRIRYA